MMLALVLTLLVGAPLAAQAVLAEDRLRMPAGLGGAVDLVAADFNRDGLVDLARASVDAVTILVQQPSGRFEVNPAQTPLVFAAPVIGLTSGSLQSGGGTRDLVVALRGAPPVVLWNVGPGTFVRAPTTLPAAPQPVAAVRAFDFDLRPPDDILVLPEQGRPQLLLAQTAGGYVDASAVLGAALFLQSACVAVADVDGDTDLDLVFASGVVAQPFVLENNGASVRSVMLPTRGAFTALATGDFDGDGRVDLALARSLPAPIEVEFLLNRPTGFVSYVPPVAFAPSSALRELIALDLGNDGDIDLVGLQTDGLLAAGVSDGAPAFRLAFPPSPLDMGPRAGLAVADLERDGDLDAVVGGAVQGEATLRDSVLLGDRVGATWFDSESVGIAVGAGPNSRLSTAIVDSDLDGEPDVVAYGPAGRGIIYRNDGTARFRELSALLPVLAMRDIARVLPIAATGPTARDLLVVASAAGGALLPPGIRLLTPAGGGTYVDVSSRLPASVGQGFRDVAVVRGGLTGRAPTEIVAVDASNLPHAFVPNAGVFVAVSGALVPNPAGAVRRLIAADLNGDQRDDVVLLEDGPSGSQVELYLRTSGTVAPLFVGRGSALALPAAVTDVAIADFDMDGRDDLVLAAPGATTPLLFVGATAQGVLIDRTSGRFPGTLPVGLDVVATLPDATRPPSLLLGGRGGSLWLLRGQGVAPFAAPEPVALHGDPRVAALQVADFDVDGDADCAIVPFVGRPSLLLGTEWHCATVGVTQAGREMTLRLRGPVAGSIAAWLWSPVGSTRLPVVPYGLLRLAPPVVSLLVLPIGPSLTQDLALPMPAASLDATLYFQAAFLDPRDLSVRLSNLEPALILAR